MKDFQTKITLWYEQNKRDLPWRNTQDPYKIWLSEVVLQQTRVAQGLSYYLNFIRAFPTVFDLSRAKEEKVLKLWQGLGYYTRARNLLQTAQTIVKDHNGDFPKNYHELLKLKGIGEYTAAAIASMAFGQATAVVDGNVVRVLSRVFGIDAPYDTSMGKKLFREKAQSLIGKQEPGKYNQAVMEFGATFCSPKTPDCPTCIFHSDCVANLQGRSHELPIKSKKTKIKNRFFNYLVFLQEKEGQTITFLNKRKNKDIWKNLYDFPIIESERILDTNETIQHPDFLKIAGESGFTILSSHTGIQHLLTHQKININFTVVKPSHLWPGLKKFTVLGLKDIANCPVPKPIETFLFEYFIKKG
jgi:A/G-specific adenine glycosylase